MLTEGSKLAQVPEQTLAGQAEGHCLLGRSMDVFFFFFFLVNFMNC